MKKVLLLFVLGLSAVVLAASMTGCDGGTRVQPTSTSTSAPTPTPTLTPTPTPPPSPTSGTTHLFAFLRPATVDPAPMSQQQIQAVRRAAKLDHAINRQAAITANPATVDIYVWPFSDQGKGWWPGTERKITGSPGAYTSVHLSFNDSNIVYSALVNGYNQIFTATIPAEGSAMGQPLQLTSDTEQHWLPHISADGSKVVFTKFDPTLNGDVVCIIDNSGGAVEKCLDLSSTTPVLTGSNIWHASWASNNKILFEAWGGPVISDEIFAISSDGGDLVQITNNGGADNYDECPSASTDGSWMAVGTWNDSAQYYEVSYFNLNTKEKYKIAGGPYTHILGSTENGDAWDPLFTSYTAVWVSQLDTDRSPQIYVDYALDIGRLSNNSYANYFESSPR